MRFGKYEVLGEIARGGMGVIYKARDPFIDRVLAIKTLLPNAEVSDQLKRRMVVEARAAGNLVHPNIVTIYDLGLIDGLPFIAMEYLEGMDLTRLIRRHPRVLLPNKVRIVATVADALEFAHRRNIVHRDIKPSNIFLLSTGTVKVVDFGIARMSDATLTSTGQLVGTLAYMAPEQVAGRTADRRSDVWSLGVVLYELLSGKRPFDSEHLPTLLVKISNEPHPPCPGLPPLLAPALGRILDRALAKEPDRRYQGMGELAADLRRFATDQRELVHSLEAQTRSDIDARVARARQLLAERSFEQSVVAIREAIDIDPTEAEAASLADRIEEDRFRDQVRSELGRVQALVERNELVNARQALRGILRRDSSLTDARALLERVEGMMRDAGQLEDTGTSILSSLPEASPFHDETRVPEAAAAAPGGEPRTDLLGSAPAAATPRPATPVPVTPRPPTPMPVTVQPPTPATPATPPSTQWARPRRAGLGPMTTVLLSALGTAVVLFVMVGPPAGLERLARLLRGGGSTAAPTPVATPAPTPEPRATRVAASPALPTAPPSTPAPPATAPPPPPTTPKAEVMVPPTPEPTVPPTTEATRTLPPTPTAPPPTPTPRRPTPTPEPTPDRAAEARARQSAERERLLAEILGRADEAAAGGRWAEVRSALAEASSLVPADPRAASWRAFDQAWAAVEAADAAFAGRDFRRAAEGYRGAVAKLGAGGDERGLRAWADRRALLADAELKLVAGDVGGAEALFGQVGGAEGEGGRKRVEIARIRPKAEQALAQNLLAEALRLYTRILTLDPADGEARERVAYIDRRQTETRGEQAATLRRQADEAFASGDFGVAADRLRALGQLEPGDARVRQRLELCGKLDQAKAALAARQCGKVESILGGIAEPAATKMVAACREALRPRRAEVQAGMVSIPAGSFAMGEDGGLPDMEPEHTVSVAAFLIDAYKVSNEEYVGYLKTSGGAPPATWPGGRIPTGKERHPVRGLSWAQADAYCRSVGKRLPTEAEWERAARGPDGRKYPWGNKHEAARYNSGGSTVPVDAFKQQASGFGVVGLLDYVWEWTSSWYAAYPGSRDRDPRFGQQARVVRGRLRSKGDRVLSVASRHAAAPEEADEHFGVRCAIGAKELAQVPE